MQGVGRSRSSLLAGSAPPFILRDGALLQLPRDGAQHLAGVVGEVQVTDLGRGDRDDGKRLLILFHRRGADLKCKVAFEGLVQRACDTRHSLWGFRQHRELAAVCRFDQPDVGNHLEESTPSRSQLSPLETGIVAIVRQEMGRYYNV